jgi:hypothetical protein
MNHPTPDAGIPVLTEIIPTPPAEVLREEFVPPPTPAPSEIERWDELEREVREAVLKQLLERIDLVLEQRVRDSLADVLQTAVDGLAVEIRSGLRESLRETVSRAVTQEISRLQAAKK